MVQIVNGADTLELKFGLGELNAIDKALGLNIQDTDLGEGLELLVPKLKSGNVIGIAKVVQATTRKQKGTPKTDEELEAVLTSIHEQYGTFKKFGETVIEELKQHVLTQDLVAEE